MMKQLCMFIVFLSQVFLAHAQVLERQVISPGGSSYSGSFSADWTLGETVVQSATVNSIQFQQGYQQPLTANGSGLIQPDDAGIRLYPNPGSGLVFLDIKGIQDLCSVEVYNITGTLLLQRAWNTGMPCTLNLESLSPGSYHVRVSGERIQFSATWIKI